VSVACETGAVIAHKTERPFVALSNTTMVEVLLCHILEDRRGKVVQQQRFQIEVLQARNDVLPGCSLPLTLAAEGQPMTIFRSSESDRASSSGSGAGDGDGDGDGGGGAGSRGGGIRSTVSHAEGSGR
jgi:uncharacterized membrane protein YgcG